MTAPQQPKVSVLLPAWNAARSLPSAIESILTQTLANFELLIIDDGSSDDTPLILRDYRDARIRVLSNEKNLGLTKSLNSGIAEARGEYIARMNAEDISSPQRLARLSEVLDANPQIALITSSASRIDDLGARVGVRTTPTDAETIRRLLRLENCIVHGAVMLRSDVLRSLNGYDESMERAQDYDLWLRLSEQHELMALPETLYASRERNTRESSDTTFHERARNRARRRFANALVQAVSDQEVTALRAARRSLERLQEEEALRIQTAPRTRSLGGLWRRIPALHRRAYLLTHLDALERVHRVFGNLEAGWQSREATSGELVACLEQLAPGASRRSATSSSRHAQR